MGNNLKELGGKKLTLKTALILTEEAQVRELLNLALL